MCSCIRLLFVSVLLFICNADCALIARPPTAGHGAIAVHNAADQMARALRTSMLAAVDPAAVGSILRDEIAANDVRFRFDSQVDLLTSHLLSQGHFENWYAGPNRRIGQDHQILSRYVIDPAVQNDNKTTDLCKQITRDVLALLFSGRVSFSVGELQNNGAAVDGGLANGLVLYANLNGHDIGNLNQNPSGRHFIWQNLAGHDAVTDHKDCDPSRGSYIRWSSLTD